MSELAFDARVGKAADDSREAFAKLVRTIAALRHPVTGCPWDLAQGHASLRRYMVEEAYEAAANMVDGAEDAELCDELGDVLLQVVLNAQVASDRGAFAIPHVIEAITSKMIRRHPHVFAPEQQLDKTVAAIHSNWVEIKKQEKKAKASDSLFAETEKVGPATTQAHKIGKVAAQIQFDWSKVSEVVGQLKSELAEFEAELQAPVVDKAKALEELGDLYFTLAQVARHMGADAESVALDGNRKFLRRFQKLEALAKSQGVDVKTASQARLEELWQEAKRVLKTS